MSIKETILEFDPNCEIETIVGQVVATREVQDVINEISSVLEEVGTMYERFEIFLAELLVAGDVARRALAFLLSTISINEIVFKGTIVFGTVKGDIHDIGKIIQSAFLIGAGFNIIDIGTDVEPETFVHEAVTNKADVVAISCLLPQCISHVQETIDLLKPRGFNNIIIGGRPVEKKVADENNVMWAFYPSDTINEIKKCLGITKTQSR